MRPRSASAFRVQELEGMIYELTKRLDKLERMYFNKGAENDSNKQPQLQRVHSR